MNEVMLVQAPKFENKELTQATKKIITITKNMEKNMYAIASILSKVAESKCYEEDGFKSVVDYAEKTFGYKKTTVYTLVNIGTNFTDTEKLTSNLPHDGQADYTTTQVEKLLPLGTHDKAVELINEGIISSDMSVREIDKAVKNYLKPVIDVECTEVDEEPTQETETDNSERSEEFDYKAFTEWVIKNHEEIYKEYVGD